MAPSRSSLLRAALAATLLLISLPFSAAAHAELASTSPADGETVVGSPAAVVATFTEALAAQSSLELRDTSGATVATGGVDPADPGSLRIAAPDLAPGTYEGRIIWFSADGHGPERATFTFTVTAPPTPTPAPTPTPSAAPSPTPTPSPTPAATASPTPAPSPAPSDPTAGTSDVLIPIVAAVVLLGGFGAWLLRRRGGGA